MRGPDPAFADPRLAVHQDVLNDGDRRDLDTYEGIAVEAGQSDLADHGFRVLDVCDAPDRPGKEIVFIASRAQRS